MKHKHILIFNSISKRYKKYTYSFGSTDGVELTISKSGFQITAELTKLYDKEEMLSGNTYLFPDAIRKALLIYLLTYSKGLKIKSVTVKIDDDEDTTVFDNEPEPPVYSMINGDLVRKIPSSFLTASVIDNILTTPKSKYDKRTASLFAYLFSKSKQFETERFIYLWTAFNGMYGYLSEYIAKGNGIDRYRRENKQIIGFQQYFDLGAETIDSNNKDKIANATVSILKEYNNAQINKKFVENSGITKRIERLLIKNDNSKYNISTYGYLLTQLSYYFRCKIVHGSKPVILFGYADDSMIHCLTIINNLLEEFIEENLPNFFDDEYITNVLISKANKIELK